MNRSIRWLHFSGSDALQMNRQWCRRLLSAEEFVDDAAVWNGCCIW